LVTEGGTLLDNHFLRISRFHDDLIRELFIREVFSLLLTKKLIGLPLVRKILSWRHTDFSVHSQVRAQTKREAVSVGKYMIRPLLSLHRLSFDDGTGKVSYRYGKDLAHEDRMDYLEFIAKVTSHIPDKGQVMVRYYGLCKALHKPYYAEFKIMLS